MFPACEGGTRSQKGVGLYGAPFGAPPPRASRYEPSNPGRPGTSCPFNLCTKLLTKAETLGHTMFIREIEVDEEKFTKLYLSQFESFWELSKPTIRFFGYIMQKMKLKSDKLEFFIDKCMEYTRYKSIKPIYAALASLMEAKIIARGYNENVYFINPMILFSGDRVSFVRSYIKKKKLKQDDSQQLSVFDAILPFSIG